MCFRPPSAGKMLKCPNCGAPCPPMAKKCTKCKTDLTGVKAEEVKAEVTEEEEDEE